MQQTKRFYVFLLAAALLCSCSKDQAEETPTPDPEPGNNVTANNVTYTNFVGGLIQAKCSACHAAGGAGSSQWAFSGYASVTTNGSRINNAVLVTGIMPMTGSLTTNEKALLKAWFDRSMPE